MKCPHCGAPSRVLATRGVVRQRECFNEHRFSTQEQVIPERTHGGYRHGKRKEPDGNESKPRPV